MENPVQTFKVSITVDAAIKALVEAIAGITFFITPNVRLYVTPSILYFFARSKAVLYIHSTSSIESLSTGLL